MTNALIKPARRMLREKLLDMTPPLILDYSDGFFSHPTWDEPNDFSPTLRTFGCVSCLITRFVTRVVVRLALVRELVLKCHHMPDLFF